MLANIQRLIALVLALAITAGWLAGLRFDRPLIGPAVAAAIVLGYLSVMAFEFASLWVSFDGTDPTRPTLSQVARAWLSESTGAPRVFLWRQPFRSNREPDSVPQAARGRRGVLFVHGFFCNRGVWNPLLRKLRAEAIPFVAVNLEPVFGSIDSHRQHLDSAVQTLADATGLAPVVVAHSMGGLAVRSWLAGDLSRAPIHRLVTIASPHGGTRLALHGVGANVVQMRPQSDWLVELDEATSSCVRERTICFWSHCDNIVAPVRNATLAGASNRHLEATPHVQMVYHPAVIAEVLALVADVG